jgi:hypothetical protein
MITENMNKIPNIKIKNIFHFPGTFYERAYFSFFKYYEQLLKKEDFKNDDLKSNIYNPLKYEFPFDIDTEEEWEIKKINNEYKFFLSQIKEH